MDDIKLIDKICFILYKDEQVIEILVVVSIIIAELILKKCDLYKMYEQETNNV